MATGGSSPPPSPLPPRSSPARNKDEEEEEEGEEREKDRDFRHTCSLCMEPYRGRSPKLLPCFHTFCLPCLTALEASVTSSPTRHEPVDDVGSEPTTGADKPEPSEGAKREGLGGEEEDAGSSAGQPEEREEDDVTKAGNDVTVRRDDVTFPCPTCRAPVAVPEGGVASLQTNFYVDHDYSAKDTPSPIPCDMCEDGNRQDATHNCQDCRLNLCRTCRRCHDMVARDHHVTHVSVSQSVKRKRRERRGYCLVHQDQALCFHCRPCDVSICLHCKLTSHDGHDTSELARAVQEAKKDIASLITTAQQQLQVMQSSIQQMDRETRQLRRHTQEVTQKVNARHDDLVTWARQSREKLVEELSAKETQAMAQLEAEKSSVTLTRDALSALLARASRATSTDPDVVMLRNDLRAALLGEDEVQHHQQRAAPEDRTWNWRYDLTEASVLHADDVQAYMGRVAEGADADLDTVPVSLRELADKVDRWMNETSEATKTLTSELTSCKDDVTALQKKEADLAKKAASLHNDVISVRITAQSMQEKIGEVSQLFRATKLDRDKTKSGQAAIFSDVPTNKGDHFNAQTGTFTVPEPGIYIFRATVETMSGEVAPMHIMVGDKCHSVVKGTYDGKSGCVLVSVSEGEKIWLKANDSGQKYYHRVSSFSGTLIR